MSKLYTAGKIQLPFTYFGVIVGTYSDFETRVIDVVVGIPEGFVKLPPFPNQPVSFGFMSTTDTAPIKVGIKKVAKDPSNSSQLIVTVDRGYYEEVAGEAQPGVYRIPLENGQLGFCSATAAGIEASEWSKVAHVIALESVVGDGIYTGLLEEFLMSETDPESMYVEIDTGIALVEDGVVFQEEPESILLEPVFDLPTEEGYLMIARIYINILNGEIGIVYGAAHATTPVAPSYPAGVIKLAQVEITQGVGTSGLVDERVLA